MVHRDASPPGMRGSGNTSVYLRDSKDRPRTGEVGERDGRLSPPNQHKVSGVPLRSSSLLLGPSTRTDPLTEGFRGPSIPLVGVPPSQDFVPETNRCPHSVSPGKGVPGEWTQSVVHNRRPLYRTPSPSVDSRETSLPVYDPPSTNHPEGRPPVNRRRATCVTNGRTGGVDVGTAL